MHPARQRWWLPARLGSGGRCCRCLCSSLLIPPVSGWLCSRLLRPLPGTSHCPCPGSGGVDPAPRRWHRDSGSRRSPRCDAVAPLVSSQLRLPFPGVFSMVHGNCLLVNVICAFPRELLPPLRSHRMLSLCVQWMLCTGTRTLVLAPGCQGALGAVLGAVPAPKQRQILCKASGKLLLKSNTVCVPCRNMA